MKLSAGNQNSDPNATEIAVVVAAEPREVEPFRPEKRKGVWLDLLAVGLSVCAFIASAGQGWVARDTEKRSLRAYASVDPAPVKDFAENVAPKAGVRVTIKGQTPAYDLTVVTNIAALPYPASQEARAAAAPSPPAEITTSMLAPGQTVDEIVALAYAPNPSQFALIKEAKKARLYVWGEVHYQDAFKMKWHNKFCFSYELTQPDSSSFEVCQTGSCADYQCDE